MDWAPAAWVHGIWGIAAYIGDSAICSPPHTVCPPCEQCLPWPNGTNPDGTRWQAVKIPVVYTEYIQRKDCEPRNPTTFQAQCPTLKPCFDWKNWLSDLRLPELDLGEDFVRDILPWLVGLLAVLLLLIYLFCIPCRHTRHRPSRNVGAPGGNLGGPSGNNGGPGGGGGGGGSDPPSSDLLREKERLEDELARCRQHGVEQQAKIDSLKAAQTSNNQTAAVREAQLRGDLEDCHKRGAGLQAKIDSDKLLLDECIRGSQVLQGQLANAQAVADEASRQLVIADRQAAEDPLAECERGRAALQRQLDDAKTLATQCLEQLNDTEARLGEAVRRRESLQNRLDLTRASEEDTERTTDGSNSLPTSHVTSDGDAPDDLDKCREERAELRRQLHAAHALASQGAEKLARLDQILQNGRSVINGSPEQYPSPTPTPAPAASAQSPSDDLERCEADRRRLRDQLDTAAEAARLAATELANARAENTRLGNALTELNATWNPTPNATNNAATNTDASPDIHAECETRQRTLQESLDAARTAQEAAETQVTDLQSQIDDAAQDANRSTDGSNLPHDGTIRTTGECEVCAATRAAVQNDIAHANAEADRKVKAAFDRVDRIMEDFEYRQLRDKQDYQDREAELRERENRIPEPECERSLREAQNRIQELKEIISGVQNGPDAESIDEVTGSGPHEDRTQNECERELRRITRQLQQAQIDLATANSWSEELEAELELKAIRLSEQSGQRSSTCEEDCRRAKEKQDQAELDLQRERARNLMTMEVTTTSLETVRREVADLNRQLGQARDATSRADRAKGQAEDRLRESREHLAAIQRSQDESKGQTTPATAPMPDENEGASITNPPVDPCADVKAELRDAREKIEQLKNDVTDAEAAQKEAEDKVRELEQTLSDKEDDHQITRLTLVQEREDAEKESADLQVSLERLQRRLDSTATGSGGTDQGQGPVSEPEESCDEVREQLRLAREELARLRRGTGAQNQPPVISPVDSFSSLLSARPLQPRQSANAPPPQPQSPPGERWAAERGDEWEAEFEVQRTALRDLLSQRVLEPRNTAPDSGSEENCDEIRRQLAEARIRIQELESQIQRLGGEQAPADPDASPAEGNGEDTTHEHHTEPAGTTDHGEAQRPASTFIFHQSNIPLAIQHRLLSMFEVVLTRINSNRSSESRVEYEELLQQWTELVPELGHELVPIDEVPRALRDLLGELLHEFEESVTTANIQIVPGIPNEKRKRISYEGTFRDGDDLYHRFELKDDEEYARVKIMSRNDANSAGVKGILEGPETQTIRGRWWSNGMRRAVQQGNAESLRPLPITPPWQIRQRELARQRALEGETTPSPSDGTTTESTPTTNRTASTTIGLGTQEDFEARTEQAERNRAFRAEEAARRGNPNYYTEQGIIERQPANKAIPIVRPPSSRRSKSVDHEDVDRGPSQQERSRRFSHPSTSPTPTRRNPLPSSSLGNTVDATEDVKIPPFRRPSETAAPSWPGFGPAVPTGPRIPTGSRISSNLQGIPPSYQQPPPSRISSGVIGDADRRRTSIRMPEFGAGDARHAERNVSPDHHAPAAENTSSVSTGGVTNPPIRQGQLMSPDFTDPFQDPPSITTPAPPLPNTNGNSAITPVPTQSTQQPTSAEPRPATTKSRGVGLKDSYWAVPRD